MTKVKQCSKCKKILLKTEFYVDKRTQDKLYSDCKKCHISQVKNYMKTEKGKKVKRISYIKWRQSFKGIECAARVKARRKRNFEWKKAFNNPFDKNIKIEWHHITDIYVVALPKDLHRLYNGHKYHRELCMEIVKQIYGGIKNEQ